MGKSRKKKTANGNSSNGSGSGLSTLVERLREKSPELIRRFESLQEEEAGEEPVIRPVDFILQALPFAWVDPGVVDEAIHLILEGQYREAAELMEGVLQDQPDAYPALFLLGHIHGCLQNYKDEGEYYKKAIRIRGNCPQLYFSLGVAYELIGKEKKAFNAYRCAVPLAPDFHVADEWLTLTFTYLGRYRHANGRDDKYARERIEWLANAFLSIGNAYVEFGHHASARHSFKRAVRIKPDFAQGYYQLGTIHIKKLRNPKRAAKYLEKAEQLFIQKNELNAAAFAHQLYRPREEVQEKDKVADDWLKEGLRLHQLGMYQAAVDAYKVAVSFKGEYLDAYYNMGVAYGSLEDNGVNVLHKAIWAFRQAVKIKPDFVHAHIALGASFIRKGEFDEAIRILDHAIDLDPAESNAYYYLGVAYRMSANAPDAIDVFRQAAELKPDSVQINFYLGLALADMRRYQEACDALEEVIRIKPDFADGHFMLGNLYLEKMNEPERAIAHLRRAEKLFVKLEDFRRSDQIRQILAEYSQVASEVTPTSI